MKIRRSYEAIDYERHIVFLHASLKGFGLVGISTILILRHGIECTALHYTGECFL